MKNDEKWDRELIDVNKDLRKMMMYSMTHSMTHKGRIQKDIAVLGNLKNLKQWWLAIEELVR